MNLKFWQATVFENEARNYVNPSYCFLAQVSGKLLNLWKFWIAQYYNFYLWKLKLSWNQLAYTSKTKLCHTLEVTGIHSHLTHFWHKFRESTVFTKEVIWRNIFIGESKFYIFPHCACKMFSWNAVWKNYWNLFLHLLDLFSKNVLKYVRVYSHVSSTLCSKWWCKNSFKSFKSMVQYGSIEWFHEIFWRISALKIALCENLFQNSKIVKIWQCW